MSEHDEQLRHENDQLRDELERLAKALDKANQATADWYNDCHQAKAREARLRGVCKLAHSALDRLMGDTDLPDDDSPEMIACQKLMEVLYPTEAATPTPTPRMVEVDESPARTLGFCPNCREAELECECWVQKEKVRPIVEALEAAISELEIAEMIRQHEDGSWYWRETGEVLINLTAAKELGIIDSKEDPQ